MFATSTPTAYDMAIWQNGVIFGIFIGIVFVTPLVFGIIASLIEFIRNKFKNHGNI